MLKGNPDILITSKDLDTHDNLLNCQNGVVDLQDGKLYPHDSSLLITQKANGIYQPHYRNPIVDKFLMDILPDDDTRAALIRFLGYSLTGSCQEEKALFFNGRGGNGKGTLTKTLINIFGDYGTTLKTNAVLLANRTSDASAATPELAPLINRRLAIVEELPQNGRLDVAKFKNLTGGDYLPIRQLHKEQTVIDPKFSLILSGNYLPTLSDPNDPGLIRRLLNIQFNGNFRDNPDPNLKKKLSTPEALSGFLSLLVDAAIEWYKDGLIVSDAMRDATRDYLSDNDFVADFAEDFCQFTPDGIIRRKDFENRLKAAYPAECSRFRPRDLSRLIAETLSKFNVFAKKGEHNNNIYLGIKWNN